MIRGILSAATAMRAQVLNQEVIANNLANADTHGYQRDKTVSGSFNDLLIYRFEPLTQAPIGGYTGGTIIYDVATLSESGPIETTGNPLDIVLPQGTYFAVETAAGTRYTRSGNLSLSGGYLTASGHRILGTNGPIQADYDDEIEIHEDGRILSHNTEIGAIQLFTFPETAVLTKESNTLFRLDGTGSYPIDSPNLIVGAIEKSSVDPVLEMVSLISSLRVYEAAQKVLQAHDETLDQAVNRVGRVSG